LWESIAKIVAGQYKFRGADRNCRNSGTIKRRSEKARAEAFAVGSDAILQSGAHSSTGLSLRRSVVLQVFAKVIEFAADAIVMRRVQVKVTKNFQVQAKNMFGVPTRIGAAASCEGADNGQQTIGDSLHRGNHYHHVALRGDGIGDQPGGVKHTVGTEQRSAAELKNDNSVG
jgi:hypothetical protein